MKRRDMLAATLASAALARPSWAQAEFNPLSAQQALIYGDGQALNSALEWIVERNDTDMVAGIIFAMRFSRARSKVFGEALETLTGASGNGDWFDWMLWQEKNPQIAHHPTYRQVKRSTLFRIDPNFKDFLDLNYIGPDKARIRLEEVTWGGVVKDGIPSLDEPTLIDGSEAGYLNEDDLVFGVSINGDIRAYPLRIMGWHEMFNEVIGGVPVALAYCTLCGSGILFETNREGGKAPFVFGSSGFLYRSNKLMFDRETHTLWNQFTGEPVMGPLASQDIKLKQRPVVITTWAEWFATNPSTKVLSLRTGFNRDYGSGVVYNDYFASPDLMFPAEVDQTVHQQKDYVFTIRDFGAARAWPLISFDNEPIIHDKIGIKDIVLFGHRATRTVRAFATNGLRFTRTSDGNLKSDDGRIWLESEEALTSGDVKLPRIPGHIAYWFAWDNYMRDKGSVYNTEG